jgi:plastocyanin
MNKMRLCVIMAPVLSIITITTSFTSTLLIISDARVAVAANNGILHKIQAGGGNSTAPLTVFVPQNMQISVGESITWNNPSTVGEPHTVTFVLDNTTTTNIVSPFSVQNSTQFTAIPPNSNNEPLRPPGKNNVVITVNSRSFVPTTIDSQGDLKQYAPPNPSYTMTGTEKYINSGWLLPKGQEQQFPGSSTSFTVTFQKPGTYNYLCALHPWMVGSVVVK